jgi:hypothetical protein
MQAVRVPQQQSFHLYHHILGGRLSVRFLPEASGNGRLKSAHFDLDCSNLSFEFQAHGNVEDKCAAIEKLRSVFEKGPHPNQN